MVWFCFFVVCSRCACPRHLQNTTHDVHSTRSSAHATNSSCPPTQTLHEHTPLPAPQHTPSAHLRALNNATHYHSNKQQTYNTHTTYIRRDPHAAGRQLSGSWHTRTLHMEQLSVSDANDRGAQEQTVPNSSFSHACFAIRS